MEFLPFPYDAATLEKTLTVDDEWYGLYYGLHFF
jgi:hypothetical protein